MFLSISLYIALIIFGLGLIFNKVRIFALNKVRRIPLAAAKNLVDAEISAAPKPILYRNQVDIL